MGGRRSSGASEGGRVRACVGDLEKGDEAGQDVRDVADCSHQSQQADFEPALSLDCVAALGQASRMIP